jgi:hypothetical protein
MVDYPNLYLLFSVNTTLPISLLQSANQEIKVRAGSVV